MKALLYFGAVCGALSAVIGAYTHDVTTVLLGGAACAANYLMAELRTERE